MRQAAVVLALMLFGSWNAMAQSSCETAFPVEMPRGAAFCDTSSTPAWYSVDVGTRALIHVSGWTRMNSRPTPYCRAVVSAYAECGTDPVAYHSDGHFGLAWASIYVWTLPQATYLKLEGHCGHNYTASIQINVLHYDVAIDIRPGDRNNRIKFDYWETIPVALLGADYLDVTDVDVTTLRFGPRRAHPAYPLHQSSEDARHLEDVNHDGFLDLVSHYRLQETGIGCGDGIASLSASLLTGATLLGVDSVWPVWCGMDHELPPDPLLDLQRSRVPELSLQE